MKLNKWLTIFAIVIFYQCSFVLLKADSGLSNTEVTLNFYDKEYNDNSSLSCKVKINYEANSCSISNDTATVGKLTIKLEEDLSKILEEEAKKEQGDPNLASAMSKANAKKLREEEKVENNSALDNLASGVKNGFERVSEAVKGALGRIGHAFRFRFLALSDKSEISTSENSNLEKKSSKLKENRDEPSTTVNPNASGNKYKKCLNRISRLSIMQTETEGVLDVRYIKDCKVDLQENPAGGFSLKLTAISRETEDNMNKIIEFVIPNSNGINKQFLTKLQERIKDSCTKNTQILYKVITELETSYCNKRSSKKIKDCDQLTDSPFKTKCVNIKKDIDDLAAELKDHSDKKNNLEKEKKKNAKELLNKNAEAETKSKDLAHENKKKKALETTSTETKKQLDELSQKHKKSQEEVIAKKKAKEEIEGKVGKLEKEVGDGEKILKAKQDEKKATSIASGEVDKQISDIDAEIEKLRGEEKKLQDKIGSLEKQTNEKKREVDSSTKDNITANDKATDAETQIKQTENDIQVNQQKLDQLLKNKGSKPEAAKPEASADTADDHTEIVKATSTVCDKLAAEVPMPLKSAIKTACNAALKGEDSGSEIVNKIVSVYQ